MGPGPWGRAGASRRGATGRRRNKEGWMDNSQPISSYTTAPPSPPDLSASTATDSPQVGQDPLSHGGEIIVE